MNGRIVGFRYYCTLAFFVLGCSYFAFAPLSALAQGAGGKGVSVTVNPTTGYTVINSQTISTPRGTTVGSSGGVPSVTVRPGGGLSQSLPAGIEITGLRQNAQTLRGPLGASINAGLGALRNTAVRCFSSFRCNNVLTIGAIGISELLRQNDMFNNDGTIMTEPVFNPPVIDPVLADYEVLGRTADQIECSVSDDYLLVRVRDTGQVVGGNPILHCQSCPSEYSPPNTTLTLPLVGYAQGSNRRPLCLYDPILPPADSPGNYSSPTPVDNLDDLFSDYTPHPSDWNFLTGGLNFSDPGVTIDITDIPILDGSNEPNFIEWSDGTSRGTFNTYTPTVRNNGSQKPEIEVKDQQTEISYDAQGNPTGSSTSTTVTPPSVSTGGGGSTSIDVPTDCDFMPTVCRFIDWFTESDTQPDPDQEIRDMVQIYEDGGRDVIVGPDSGACPLPRTIELSLVPSVEFSFQPFCDLATAVRFWLLAIAAFSSAYMTVRSI